MFLDDHPKARWLHNTAEAYLLPSHQAYGSPILRHAPNDAAVSFVQGRCIPDQWSVKPSSVDACNGPENMFPLPIDRYGTAHMYSLSDSAYTPETFMVDDLQLEVHNTPCGSFVTNKDGILVAPPGNSSLFAQKLSPMLKHSPKSFGKGDVRFNGVPMGSIVANQQPFTFSVSHDTNPYFMEDGAWVEVMPPPDSQINEQFLTGLQKATQPYFTRQEILADKKWMEPNIPTGFSERAKHSQGIDLSGGVEKDATIASSNQAAENSVKLVHPLTGKNVEGTMFKPGLRGGGDAMIPSNVMIAVDSIASQPDTKQEDLDNASQAYSYLKGIVLKPEQDIFKQPPYVILRDGTMEPIIAGQNMKRIANSTAKKSAVKLLGGYLGQIVSTVIWHSTPRYTCAGCGSCFHGLKQCPAHYIKGSHNSCMSCGQAGHLLAACPYPIQNHPTRTIVQSFLLYLGTLHCRMSILTWEFEHAVIDEAKFLRLRAELTSNPLQGEALHALANLPGCPACDASSHQTSIGMLIEECANRCRERSDIPESMISPDQWMYDNRRCPLYTIVYNKNTELKGYEFFAYNPNNSVALDAVYRDFLAGQEVSLGHVRPSACSLTNFL